MPSEQLSIAATAEVVAHGPLEASVALSWQVTGAATPETLKYSILYAPEGEHWQLIAAGLEGSGYVVETLEGLPDGDAEAFRVLAFDGSRVVGALVPVDLPGPRNPPLVYLDDPRPRTEPVNAELVLSANAFDREDRIAKVDALTWKSSIDGDLGLGAELRTRDLSPGRHVITVTGVDSDGLEGEASVEVTVDPAVVGPRAGAELEAAVARIFGALGSGQDPAPQPEPGAVMVQFPWLGVAAILLLAAIVLVGVARGKSSSWIRVSTPRASGGYKTDLKLRRDAEKPATTVDPNSGADEPQVAGDAGAAGAGADASKDVQMKGKNIGEN